MKTFLSFFVLVLLVSCSSHYYLSTANLTYYDLAKVRSEGTPALDSMIRPYRNRLQTEMTREIGFLEVDMVKERPESNMGNWLADMLLVEAQKRVEEKIDFAVQNHGGMRLNFLAAGPIVTGEVYEIMPFDNLVTIIEADGHLTKLFLDHIAEDGGWPISRGLVFQINDSKADSIYINNSKLHMDSIYRFVVPDYIASGGSGSFMLAEGKRQDLGILVRDAFLNHIAEDTERGSTQNAVKEGRIINKANE